MWHDEMSGDALQAGLERLARKAEAARKAGKCPHGWGRSRTATLHAVPLDEEQARIPIGGFLCYHCGKVFDDERVAHAERREALR